MNITEYARHIEGCFISHWLLHTTAKNGTFVRSTDTLTNIETHPVSVWLPNRLHHFTSEFGIVPPCIEGILGVCHLDKPPGCNISRGKSWPSPARSSHAETQKLKSCPLPVSQLDKHPASHTPHPLYRYQNVWMYVIHEMENAVDACNNGGETPSLFGFCPPNLSPARRVNCEHGAQKKEVKRFCFKRHTYLHYTQGIVFHRPSFVLRLLVEPTNVYLACPITLLH